MRLSSRAIRLSGEVKQQLYHEKPVKGSPPIVAGPAGTSRFTRQEEVQSRALMLVFTENLNKGFQLAGRRLIEVDELHTDLKKVLCKPLGMNNLCPALYCCSRFVIHMQAEMHFDIGIQHHPERCLVIREYIVNRKQVTAELHTATGQIMYQGNFHLATGRPDLTRNFRFDTETFPVTAQVLARFFFEVHRDHDIFSKGRVSHSDGNLCLSL